MTKELINELLSYGGAINDLTELTLIDFVGITDYWEYNNKLSFSFNNNIYEIKSSLKNVETHMFIENGKIVLEFIG